MPKTFREFFTRKIYKKIWRQADDVIESNRLLEDIYDNVPDDLKKIPLQVMEIHIFPEQHRERISAFLNNEPYNNSVDFIKTE